MNAGADRGVIFDIKRYAVNDGPGIRTTVFFKGCPLDCAWCHNPESKSPSFEISYRQNRCLGCGQCLRSCPREALVIEGGLVVLDRSRCDLCGVCAQTCPTEALERIGREITVAELIGEVEKDRPFFEESGGGVTFSGGEPLLQPLFLEAVLRACRERKLSTCLDTSGYAPLEVLERIRDLVDVFLYDLKSVEAGTHQRATGVSNRLILENLDRLSRNGSRIIIRVPVIPGVNDSVRQGRSLAGFVSGLSGVGDVSLLPYHDIAADKVRRLGRPAGARIRRLDPAKLEAVKKEFENRGLRVKVGS